MRGTEKNPKVKTLKAVTLYVMKWFIGWFMRFVEIMLGAKFLHSCRGGGSFINPGGSNRVPHERTAFTPMSAWSPGNFEKYPES